MQNFQVKYTFTGTYSALSNYVENEFMKLELI